MWNTFNRTGVTHLLSVSGLHVTMVAGLFGGLVGWVWRRRPGLALRLPAQRAGLLAGWWAAFFYTLLAGFAVPAQRTLYMLSVAVVSCLTGRAVAPSRTLALALAVVLLLDPWAVLAPGFWLSFGAVAALFYISVGRAGEGLGWRYQLLAWGRSQWAATLASLPILLLVFQQLSLVSPLSNGVAIPVISLVVTPLALLGAVFAWHPLLYLLHSMVAWLMVFLEWCATWPVWHSPAPPLWAACGAALGVVVMLLPRGVPARGLGGVLLLPALFWPAGAPEFGAFRLTVLDVGQGLATLVETREGATLYDTGPLYSAESDAGQRVVVPYLRALGINHLQTLVVTHRDSDHAGGAASVMAAVPVARVLSSVENFPGERCEAGQSWVSGGVAFSVLHPLSSDYGGAGKSNHMSCVLRVTGSGGSVLLTSDIEAPDEVALLAREAPLQAAVMLAPHHGSKTSSTPGFLDAVGAREVIFPVGYRNRFGHPKAEILARYEARGGRLWRSDRDGAVMVHMGPGGYAITAQRQVHPRYWHGR